MWVRWVMWLSCMVVLGDVVALAVLGDVVMLVVLGDVVVLYGCVG